MTTLEPETLAAAAEQPKARGKFGNVAFGVSLVVSIIGNVVQWRTNTAQAEQSRAAASQLRQEADKTAAEVQSLKQQQAESGERSVQSWLEELKKFDAPEDRAMVLSAAISTTSDERVKTWARDQLNLVEQALTERKRIAEAQLAVAENASHAAEAPAPTAGAGGAATGGGASGHAASPGMAAPPVVTRDPKAAARVLATRDLSRINRAEVLLKSAKEPSRVQ